MLTYFAKHINLKASVIDYFIFKVTILRCIYFYIFFLLSLNMLFWFSGDEN